MKVCVTAHGAHQFKARADIVEAGNHEELLAKDGFYAKLYNSQFEDCN